MGRWNWSKNDWSNFAQIEILADGLNYPNDYGGTQRPILGVRKNLEQTLRG